jgi:hypothetical protein
MASLPPVLAAAAPLNPLEGLIMGINTNPYFIGLMMLLLNLGGRFLGMEISKEQEKFFQQPWVRRALIFTVLFVATRNVIVAFIMTIFVVLIMTVLLNENSVFYLGAPVQPVEAPKEGQIGLSPEEQDILRKLMEKQARFAPKDKESYQDKKKDGFTAEIIYMQNLQRINS